MVMGWAHYFSRKSRAATGSSEEHFLGEDKEWLLIFSRDLLKEKYYDFFVFGHRHLPIDYRLDKGSRYINLGDWISFFTYAVFDGSEMELVAHTGQHDKIIRKRGKDFLP